MGLRDISAMGPVSFPWDGNLTDSPSQEAHIGPDFPVLLIGAGVAMFGTSEGPWNSALRLENRLGARLKVQAVIDVSRERAEAALELKRQSLVKGAYENALVLPSVAEFKQYVDAGKAVAPEAVFVATPPRWRGSLQKGYDLEMQILEAFPHVHLFIEKPPATGVPWDQSVADAKKIGELLGDRSRYKGVHSMGYVLRYNRGAREIKKILEERNLTVMATVARYFGAYELATKTDWWDTSISLGPILEQGTHLCDLSRFFGGDIDPETMHAHVLEAWEKPTSTLSKLSFNEEEIEIQNRVPRCTSATWKYASGAVGTFVHGTVLHGVDYSIEIEVYADGHQLILQDPFGVPSISIREPGSDVPRVIPMTGDDPYQTEMDAFIDCIESEGKDNRVLSTFEDAAKSYEMTWAMRNSAEQSGKEQRKKKGRTDVPSWSSEWK